MWSVEVCFYIYSQCKMETNTKSTAVKCYVNRNMYEKLSLSEVLHRFKVSWLIVHPSFLSYLFFHRQKIASGYILNQPKKCPCLRRKRGIACSLKLFAGCFMATLLSWFDNWYMSLPFLVNKPSSFTLERISGARSVIDFWKRLSTKSFTSLLTHMLSIL